MSTVPGRQQPLHMPMLQDGAGGAGGGGHHHYDMSQAAALN